MVQKPFVSKLYLGTSFHCDFPYSLMTHKKIEYSWTVISKMGAVWKIITMGYLIIRLDTILAPYLKKKILVFSFGIVEHALILNDFLHFQYHINKLSIMSSDNHMNNSEKEVDEVDAALSDLEITLEGGKTSNTLVVSVSHTRRPDISTALFCLSV